MTGRRLRDRIRPGVRVLFVGINPGLRSAATGHHFAGFSNRFWKLLYESGLVSEPITYEDDDRLPEWGYGVTNIVSRATAGIDEIRPAEYRAGARTLLRKIRRYKPDVVAVVGVTVWRALLEALGETTFRKQMVTLGFQTLAIHGARVCVLPNPSGRNATVSYPEMVRAFRQLAASRNQQSESRNPGPGSRSPALGTRDPEPEPRNARTRSMNRRTRAT